MEDLDMLGADYVVISCCCQCLTLQTLIFVFLKLPYKLAKKTREYAKKKLQERKRDHEVMKREIDSHKDYELLWIQENSYRIQLEEGEFVDARHSLAGCMEEVEKVMEEISQNGEFAFGSSWVGRGHGFSLQL